MLDAYGLVAFMAEERGAGEVEDLIRAGASITTVHLAEAVDRMARLYAADIRFDLEALAATRLDVVPLDMDLALLAGELRGRYDDTGGATISLPDCIAAVTALDQGVPLATSDPALARLMVTEGGSVVALPDSQGRRPG